jgi:hypothetical protein
VIDVSEIPDVDVVIVNVCDFCFCGGPYCEIDFCVGVVGDEGNRGFGIDVVDKVLCKEGVSPVLKIRKRPVNRRVLLCDDRLRGGCTVRPRKSSNYRNAAAFDSQATISTITIYTYVENIVFK